jgi:acetoin utilization deacetylase AcuC-like enzyme
MTTLLLSRPPWFEHHTPLWHPERQDRMRAVENALEDECFAWLIREQAVEAARETVALVHPEPYIQSIIDAVPLEGLDGVDAPPTASACQSGGVTAHSRRHP